MNNEQQGDNNKPKRNPFCSRCRNHGKSAQVKGHKRHCEYRHCQCEGCKLVECRQIVSAAQIKRRRYQKQDEECGRRIEVSPPILTRQPMPSAQLNMIQHIPNASSPTALGNALQLFQFPSSIFSAAAAASMNRKSSSKPSSTSGASSLSVHFGGTETSGGGGQAAFSSPALLISAREQMNLVEEFYSKYGPLAIYSWLKAEQFDLMKIRDSIEASRASYNTLINSFDEMPQLTGPLDLTSPIVD